MKQSAHPFLQLLVMLAFSLAMLLAITVVGVVIGVAAVASGAEFDANVLSSNLWIESITQILTFALPVLAMTLIYYRGSMREYYRLDFSGRSWLLALAGIVVMLLVVPVNEWLTQWNDSWDLGVLGEKLRLLQDKTEGFMEQLLAVDTVGGLMANLLVVAVVPAVCEELFFRAGFQNLLQRWFNNPHAAVLVTAVIFSLGHGEVFSFMPRFVLGAVLGYLYVYGGSLLVNMTAHFANNAIVVMLYWLVARGVLDIDPEAPMNFGVVLTICCTLAAVAVFIVTFVKRLKTKE